ncbi:lamin tail domain-containing protein [Candidatus Falkowbacteria bacterium]|nr:lamin tail domain-containing protein [Candidatus Falkowbacteria bacterium]
MKKYLCCLVLLAGIIVGITRIDVQNASAQSFFQQNAVSPFRLSISSANETEVDPEFSVVNNAISNSNIYQYILINCQKDECGWLADILKNEAIGVQFSQKVQPSIILSESGALPAPNVQLNGTFESGVQSGAESEASVAEKTPLPVASASSGNNGQETSAPIENNVEAVTLAPASNEKTVGTALEPSVTPVESAAAPADEKNAANNSKVSPKQIRISEVMSTPLTGQKEWIELYNSLDYPVDLAGWQLIEGAGKITSIKGVVNANNFIVFEKDSLNNSGDIVILKDAAGAIIDSITYGDWDDGNVSDNALKTANGQSLILSDGNYFATDTPTPNLANVFFQKPAALAIQESSTSNVVQTSNGTSASASVQQEATAVNNQPAQSVSVGPAASIAMKENAEPIYQFSDKIFINEFLADPLGSDDDEWIELFNDELEPVNLFGWSLDDVEAGSQPYVIGKATVIGAKEFLVFKREETSLVLNNSTDSVVLRAPDGKTISRFDYKNVKEGYGFANFSDGWQETSILTPGALNKKSTLAVALAVAQSADEGFVKMKTSSTNKKMLVFRQIDVDEVKATELGASIAVQGAIIALPDVFGKKIAYINGLQIYFDKAEWPILKIGDIISVRGTIFENSGERRLVVKKKDDIQVLKESVSVEPLKISGADISKDIVGKFVQLSGALIEKKPNKLILADDSAEFIVYLKKGAQIDQKIFELNDELEVTSIVSAFDNEVRLLPRSGKDIVNLSWQKLNLPASPSVSETQSADGRKKTLIVLLFLFAVVIGVNVYLAVVHRKIVLEKINKAINYF